MRLTRTVRPYSTYALSEKPYRICHGWTPQHCGENVLLFSVLDLRLLTSFSLCPSNTDCSRQPPTPRARSVFKTNKAFFHTVDINHVIVLRRILFWIHFWVWGLTLVAIDLTACLTSNPSIWRNESFSTISPFYSSFVSTHFRTSLQI